MTHRIGAGMQAQGEKRAWRHLRADGSSCTRHRPRAARPTARKCPPWRCAWARAVRLAPPGWPQCCAGRPARPADVRAMAAQLKTLKELLKANGSTTQRQSLPAARSPFKSIQLQPVSANAVPSMTACRAAAAAAHQASPHAAMHLHSNIRYELCGTQYSH